MIPRERCTYSAIVDRPPLKLPNQARIVVWTIVNLEFWSISRAMARQVLPAPTGEVLVPDVPNWSWHEYGMRVGVWRFFDLFARFAANFLRQRGGHEGIQIAIQHILGRAAFHASAQILHQLIRLQDIGPDLMTPADVRFLADKGAGFGFLLFQFDLVQF